MHVYDLWGAWVPNYPNYTDDVIIRDHRYKHIVASRLVFSIGVENLQFLTVEEAVAA